MIKNILLVLTIVSSFSCGRESSLDLGGFDQYVVAFEEMAALQGHSFKVTDLKISVGELEVNQLGVCKLKEGQQPEIVLSQDLYEAGAVNEFTENGTYSTADAKREAAMFHELGHCGLYRVHRDELDNLGYKKSVMSSRVVSSAVYAYFRDTKYSQELFEMEFRNEMGFDAAAVLDTTNQLSIINIFSKSLKAATAETVIFDEHDEGHQD